MNVSQVLENHEVFNKVFRTLQAERDQTICIWKSESEHFRAFNAQIKASLIIFFFPIFFFFVSNLNCLYSGLNYFSISLQTDFFSNVTYRPIKEWGCEKRHNQTMGQDLGFLCIYFFLFPEEYFWWQRSRIAKKMINIWSIVCSSWRGSSFRRKWKEMCEIILYNYKCL